LDLFRFVLLGIIVAATVSCGGQATSNPSDAARLKEYQNSFSESFWSKADFRMQPTYSITFQDSKDSVLATIETHGIDYSSPSSKRTFYYDHLNRYQKSESVVYYLDSLAVSLPPEGRTDYVVEYFYSPTDESMIDHYSQKYWDLQTGYLKMEYLWTGANFERDIAKEIAQKLTNYDATNNLQTITSTEISGSVRHFNNQGLMTIEERDRDNNLENGYELITTSERDGDGKLLVTDSGSEGNIFSTFEYDAGGVLSRVKTFSNPDWPDIIESYYFTTIEDKKVVIVETERSSTFGSSFETSITFVEDKPCHKTSINRLRFVRPATKWSTCYDANYWQSPI
jgi:hypothetical protein